MCQLMAIPTITASAPLPITAGEQPKRLIVVGAGGCGREIMQWAFDVAACGQAPWHPYGFIDDNPQVLEGKSSVAPYLGTIQGWQPHPEELFVMGIADPKIKRRLVALLQSRGARFTGLVHPSALVAATATVGQGVVLCPYGVISANSTVGDFVLVNIYSCICHDAQVGDYSTISNHCDLTGGVTLGAEVFVGSHSSIIPGITVGAGAYLGAGSVVVRPVPAGAKVVGVPARPIAPTAG